MSTHSPFTPSPVCVGRTFAKTISHSPFIAYLSSRVSFSPTSGHLADLLSLPSIRRRHLRFHPSCLFFPPRCLAAHRHGRQRGRGSSAGRRSLRLVLRPSAPQVGPHVFVTDHWRGFASSRQLASATLSFCRLDLLLDHIRFFQLLADYAWIGFDCGFVSSTPSPRGCVNIPGNAGEIK